MDGEGPQVPVIGIIFVELVGKTCPFEFSHTLTPKPEKVGDTIGFTVTVNV